MLRIIEGKEKLLDRRDEKNDIEIEKKVSEIIYAVAQNGDKAVKEFTEKFDKTVIDDLELSREEWDEAAGGVPVKYRDMLTRAAKNITEYHEKQLPGGYELRREGVVLGQRVIPLERVGIYVPGGTASYPSTVLMNAIPAKLAGVKELIMVTPPSKDGTIRSEVLLAAKLAGVDRVFKVGGAQAIAALAYGTESIPKVDKITGPGNVFVATAKKLVFGRVDIDMIAGPSEILIIADKGADPVYLAADMLSQAEHDKLAAAVLVTTDKHVAYEVIKELDRQIPLLERAEIARTSIDNNGKIYIARDVAEAVEIANSLAPEHLEIMTDNPFDVLPNVVNAGSVFLGKYTPEPLGDYYAGANHTLPTVGTARFRSPLSVEDFRKRSSYLCYTEEALKECADDVVMFADSEGLTAHAKSILVRKK